MNRILAEAYRSIRISGNFALSKLTEVRNDWELAKGIINNFNVQAMGEDLAKLVIFQIVLYVDDYPSREVLTEIVGRAENLATELWSELPEEPHMDEIAILAGREEESLIQRLGFSTGGGQ